MGKYTVKIEPEAKKELIAHYKSGNKAIKTKIEKILIELSDHPFTGTGKPEQLKYQLTGFWSRRINQKHRLIYQVFENEVLVIVISAMGHYGDK